MLFRKKTVKLPAFEVYSNCYELPFYNWIKINTTKDLKWLVKAGKYDSSDLSGIYDAILEEYQVLIKDATSSQMLELSKEIKYLHNKLLIIEVIVGKLATKSDAKLIALLQNELGFRLKYNDLEKDLPLTIAFAKSDLMRLKKAEAEYLKIINSKGSDSTENDFLEQLSVLAKFQGVGVIRPTDISLAEYIVLLNRFKAHYKQQNGR